MSSKTISYLELECRSQTAKQTSTYCSANFGVNPIQTDKQMSEQIEVRQRQTYLRVIIWSSLWCVSEGPSTSFTAACLLWNSNQTLDVNIALGSLRAPKRSTNLNAKLKVGDKTLVTAEDTSYWERIYCLLSKKIKPQLAEYNRAIEKNNFKFNYEMRESLNGEYNRHWLYLILLII